MILRQGDWSFAKIKETDITGKKIKLKKNEYVFAEGEATGHFHTIVAPKLEDMEIYKLADGSYITKLHKDGYVTHPEHSMKTDLVIPAGVYKMYQRREKDWFSLSVRRVID